MLLSLIGLLLTGTIMCVIYGVYAEKDNPKTKEEWKGGWNI